MKRLIIKILMARVRAELEKIHEIAEEPELMAYVEDEVQRWLEEKLGVD